MEIIRPRIQGVERRMVKAITFIDTYFPGLGTNPEMRKRFSDFLEDAELTPDDQIAIEKAARGRLNGTSGEIFGTVNSLRTDPAIQKPH